GAGIFGMLSNRCTGRQVDDRLSFRDRKRPGIAGHVPIKLVILVEEAENAGCPIGDLVSVRSRIDKRVCAADLYAFAVDDRFDRIGLIVTVAPDLQHVETDIRVKTVAIPVAGWNIAEYAVPDGIALGYDRDGLLEYDRGIGADIRLGNEIGY